MYPSYIQNCHREERWKDASCEDVRDNVEGDVVLIFNLAYLLRLLQDLLHCYTFSLGFSPVFL